MSDQTSHGDDYEVKDAIPNDLAEDIIAGVAGTPTDPDGNDLDDSEMV